MIIVETLIKRAEIYKQFGDVIDNEYDLAEIYEKLNEKSK